MIKEPLGRTTRIGRDTLGRVTRSESPAGHVVGSSYTGQDLTQLWDSTTNQTQSYNYLAGTPYLQQSTGTLEPNRYYT